MFKILNYTRFLGMHCPGIKAQACGRSYAMRSQKRLDRKRYVNSKHREAGSGSHL